MARVVRPSRPQQGRGLGERLSEYAVYIVIAIVAFAGWRVYMNYRQSPGAALSGFIQAEIDSNIDRQYSLLTIASQGRFGSQQAYADKWPLARGNTGRMQSFKLNNVLQTGESASGDADVVIRQPTSDLLQISTDTAHDHYVLLHEGGQWKIDLDKSKINSLKFASP